MNATGVLALLCAALLGVIVWEVDVGTAVPPAPPLIMAPVPERPGRDIGPSGPDPRLETILARPLFTPSRRPPVANMPPAALKMPEPGLPRLSAILAGPFGRRAIFEFPPGKRAVTVTVGDQIQEYRVQSIDERVVTLTGPAGQRRLSISLPATPQALPAAAAAAMPDLPPGMIPEDLAVLTPARSKP